MDGMIQWGLNIVWWIQSFRNPFLDEAFLRVNVLGDQDFYILLLPLLYWCLSKFLGTRLGVLLLLSFYANQYLKDLIAAPRPYQVDGRLYAPVKQAGFGLPSGHAQGTTTVWGYLATQLKKPLAWAAAVAIPFLVSIGRMYLGDHFPQDVLAGALIGIILITVYFFLEPRAAEWFAKQSLGTKLFLAAIMPLVLAVLHLTEDTAAAIGIFGGFCVGSVLENNWIRFDSRAIWWKQVLKFLIGIAVALALRLGLKAILPGAPLFDLLRYALIGLWISLIAPWIFVSLGLARSESRVARAPTSVTSVDPAS